MVKLQSSPISLKIVFMYKRGVPIITSLIFMSPQYTHDEHGQTNDDVDDNGNMGMHNTESWNHPNSKDKMSCRVLIEKEGNALYNCRVTPCILSSKVASLESRHGMEAHLHGVNIGEVRGVYKGQPLVIDRNYIDYGRSSRHANTCGRFLLINKNLGSSERKLVCGCAPYKGQYLILDKRQTAFGFSRRGHDNGYVNKGNCLMIKKEHTVCGRRMHAHGFVFMIKKKCDCCRRKHVNGRVCYKGQWLVIKMKPISYGRKRHVSNGEDVYNEGAGKSDTLDGIVVEHNGVWKGPQLMGTSGFLSWPKVDSLYDKFAFLTEVLGGHAMIKVTLDATESPKISSPPHVQGPSPSQGVVENNKEDPSHVGSVSLIGDAVGNQTCMIKEKRKPGEIIDKGHQSYDLMLSLQLGIRYSVGKVTPQCRQSLTRQDFCSKSNISLGFPRDGSRMTPPHQSTDFKWKDYCPMVFRYLRETFKIDAADYMLSICGNDGLRGLSSPGKSGSVFYLSHDERYMIKTLRKTEVKVLLRMLPRYYRHVQKYESTLLTRFLGLHRIKTLGGQKVRFVVMRNVLSTDLWIHKKFDLKGSSLGRSVGNVDPNEHTTLKDLDLDYVFRIDQRLGALILSQVAEDCKFLESERIMDYSLLLGVHFKEPCRRPAQTGDCKYDFALYKMESSRFNENSGKFVELTMGSKCLPMSYLRFKQGLGIDALDYDDLKCDAINKADIGQMLHQEERLTVQIGSDMPATACQRINVNGGNECYEDPHDGNDVMLSFGIIDILQEYNMGKKLEHAYKSLQFDSHSISAVDPASYSRRFQRFMHDIFRYGQDGEARI